MLFNSIEYLFCFIPIVFIIYFLLNKFKYFESAKIFLLFASIYFYASYKWDYVYIIMVSVIFNYLISYIFKFDKYQKIKKHLLIFAVLGNIAVLYFFKYFTFLAEAFANMNFTYLSTIHIVLPLGISFFTIQQIAYLVDCYKGDIKEYKFFDYALFICFFPQLIAGPIVRYNEMIKQFNNLKNRAINQENIYIGLFLITAGLIKKVILADGFIQFLNYVTEYNLLTNVYISWLFGISKVLQAYFDFSAYCDLAIGSAFLFNISLPWNFNSPFQAESMIEFWQRWNMTLMRFLKDYIYRPLTKENANMFTKIRNILIVFTAMGIWGGGSPMSVIYGLLNGIFVSINKIFTATSIKINKYIGIFITFICVVYSTLTLSVKSVPEFINLTKVLAGINSINLKIYIQNWDIILVSVPPVMAKLNILLLIACLIIVIFFQNSNRLARMYAKADNIFYTILLAFAFIYSVLSLTKSTEFIYFAF